MSEAPYPPAEPPADGDRTNQVPPPNQPRYSAAASVPVPPTSGTAPAHQAPAQLNLPQLGQPQFGQPTPGQTQPATPAGRVYGQPSAPTGDGRAPTPGQTYGTPQAATTPGGFTYSSSSHTQSGDAGPQPSAWAGPGDAANGSYPPAPVTNPMTVPTSAGAGTVGTAGGQTGTTYGSSAQSQGGHNPAAAPAQGAVYGRPANAGGTTAGDATVAHYAPGTHQAPAHAAPTASNVGSPAGQASVGYTPHTYPTASSAGAHAQPSGFAVAATPEAQGLGQQQQPGGASRAAVSVPTGGWPYAQAETPQAKPRRRGLIITFSAIIVVMLLGGASFMAWRFLNQSGSFAVGSCVTQDGGGAKTVDCTTTGAYRIVGIVADEAGCADPSQPSLVLPDGLSGKKYACLAPATP